MLLGHITKGKAARYADIFQCLTFGTLFTPRRLRGLRHQFCPLSLRLQKSATSSSVSSWSERSRTVRWDFRLERKHPADPYGKNNPHPDESRRAQYFAVIENVARARRVIRGSLLYVSARVLLRSVVPARHSILLVLLYRFLCYGFRFKFRSVGFVQRYNELFPSSVGWEVWFGL